MKILDELYNGNVCEIHRKIPQNKSKIEFELYEQLKNKLDKDQLSLFLNYCDIVGERCDLAMQDKYIQGFKTGLLIGIECKDINLE